MVKEGRKEREKDKPGTHHQGNGYRRIYSQQKHHGPQTARTYSDTHRTRLSRFKDERVCT